MANKKTLLFLGGLFAVWLIVQVRHEKADERILSLDDATFPAAINNHPIALVEFGAPWCGPCRQIQPALNKLVEEYGDDVAFYQINIDDAPGLGSTYAVSGIPLVALFVAGEVQGTLLGAQSYQEYDALIRSHLTQHQHDPEGPPSLP